MLRTAIAFFATLSMFFSSAVNAELAIIVHPGADTGAIDAQKIRRIFLGERNSFPNGLYAVPYNHVVGSPDRKAFFSLVLNMTESGHSRHWSRKISANGSHSPNELSSHQDVLESIAATPGSIAYIDANAVDDSVKVILTISDFNGV